MLRAASSLTLHSLLSGCLRNIFLFADSHACGLSHPSVCSLHWPPQVSPPVLECAGLIEKAAPVRSRKESEGTSKLKQRGQQWTKHNHIVTDIAKLKQQSRSSSVVVSKIPSINPGFHIHSPPRMRPAKHGHPLIFAYICNEVYLAWLMMAAIPTGPQKMLCFLIEPRTWKYFMLGLILHASQKKTSNYQIYHSCLIYSISNCFNNKHFRKSDSCHIAIYSLHVPTCIMYC